MSSWKWSDKWVLVAGTGKDDQISAEVRAEAQALGEHLATGGYGLITGGWPGVDQIIAVAYLARLRALDVDPAAHFKQVLQRGRAPTLYEGTMVFVETGTREYIESVKLVHALVLVGGLEGTYEVYEMAKLGGRIPVFPLPATGGNARRAFTDLHKHWDTWSALYPGLDKDRLNELDAPSAAASGAVTRLLQKVLGSPDPAAPTSVKELTGPAGRENESALQKLLAVFRDQGVTGFVGAGSSVRAGYPTWGQLLDKMDRALEGSRSAEELGRIRQEPDLLVRAGSYRDLLGKSDYNTFVRRTFRPEEGEPGEFHKDLVSLPFRHVLTTNYDDLLERAHVSAFANMPARVELTNPSDVQDFLVSGKQGRRYVYLHGRFNNPADIVLTEEDYQVRYLQSGNASTLLTVLFATHQFLFVGFSLADLDVMSIVRRVTAQLQIEEPRHFALLPLGPSDDPAGVRRKLHTKYKIEPIFYPATRDHARLHDLLRRLLEELQPKDDLPPDERELIREILRRGGGADYRLGPDFKRETPIHSVLRALRKRGWIRPLVGGSWEPGKQVEITALGRYEIDRRKIS
jgi:predicted Rossmann-fold nucleotide-binding protein